MKIPAHLISILLLCLSTSGKASPTSGNAEQHDSTTTVLFIGNSFTGANYLPTALQALAQANGKELSFEAQVKNGTSLYQHWESGEAQQQIRSRNWDFVILQDASASALEHPDKTLNYGRRFADMITKQGATTLLFETWAYKGVPAWVDRLEDNNEKQQYVDFIPAMYDATNALYRKLAETSSGQIVPVAEAWHEMGRINPGVELHAEDRSHPSEMGTYMTALVFYRALFNEMPRKLPVSLASKRNQDRLTETIVIEVPRQISTQMMAGVEAAYASLRQ